MSNSNNPSEQKKYDSRALIARIGSRDNPTTVVMVEGWAKSLRINEAPGKDPGTTRKVANLRISSVMHESRIKYAFGEKAVTPDYPDSVTFDISFWDRAAEQLEKFPPAKDQTVQVMFINPKVDEYTSNGKTYRTIKGTGLDRVNPVTARGDKEPLVPTGKSGSNRSQGSANGTASEPQSSGFGGFSEYSDFDEDDELPF